MNNVTSDSQATQFRSYAIIALSSLVGLLMALPFAETSSPTFAVAATGLGALVGFRRRHDHWFLYVNIVVAMTMISVMALQGFS